MQNAEDANADQIKRVCVRILPDGRLTRQDAAKYLGCAKKTMEMWALNGVGPRAHRVGGRVFYFKTALDAFIAGE